MSGDRIGGGTDGSDGGSVGDRADGVRGTAHDTLAEAEEVRRAGQTVRSALADAARRVGGESEDALHAFALDLTRAAAVLQEVARASAEVRHLVATVGVRLDAAQDELHRATGRLAGRFDELERARAELVDAERSEASTAVLLLTTRQKHQACLRRAEEQRTLAAELDADVLRLRAEAESLREGSARSQAERDRARADLREAERQKAEADGELASAQREFEEQRSAAEALRGRAAQLHGRAVEEHDAARHDAEELDRQTAQLRADTAVRQDQAATTLTGLDRVRHEREQADARLSLLRAELAADRRRLLQVELARQAEESWSEIQGDSGAFGGDPSPNDPDAEGLWARIHLALLRLPDEERLGLSRRFAETAHRFGAQPGGTGPDEGARPGAAVPVLERGGPASERPWVWLDRPQWPDLDETAREQVRGLLTEAHGRAAPGRALPPEFSGTPDPEHLVVAQAVRVQQALELLALDPGLGRLLDTPAHDWQPWTTEGLRSRAVNLLAELAVCVSRTRPGPEDRPVVQQLVELDELLAIHHRAPALPGSWWWRWRRADLASLRARAQRAGLRVWTEDDEFTELLVLKLSEPRLERVLRRPSPVLQWIAAVPVVDEVTRKPVCRGLVVCGEVHG
ncbi:hypothetical protein ACIRBX_01110 [Kitasatospora sp. NPDC096147]|uniref:hypothetical protein n=1 Tax=Kitasatospora sp. NPDC096147 TaxID=3364093 RepID=UPI003821614E